MLVIRLSRTGRKNLPDYNVVVTEKTNAAISGKILEKIGHFNPIAENAQVIFQSERLDHWIKSGARPSETLARLLKKQGVQGMDAFYDVKKQFKKRNKKAPAEEPKAAPAPAAEVATEAAPEPAAEEAPATE